MHSGRCAKHLCHGIDPADFHGFCSNTATPPLPTVHLVNNYPSQGWEPGGQDRPSDISFFIWRDGNTNTDLTVYYTVGGTASNGVDYQTIPESVTFPAGSLYGIGVSIHPLEDAEVEGTETVTLTLRPDPHYQVGSPNTGTVFIRDNDYDIPATVSVSASGAASESGPGEGWTNFRFDRSPYSGTSAPLTVYFTLGGTAINGVDYEQLSNSVTFPFGVYTTYLRVQPIDDTEVEGDETVVLTISTNSAYTIGSPSGATVTIADNDSLLWTR